MAIINALVSFSRALCVLEPINELNMIFGEDITKVIITDIVHYLLHTFIIQCCTLQCRQLESPLVLERCERVLVEHHSGSTKETYDEVQCRDLVQQLILGIEYIHYQNAVHRDIKPANLLISTQRDGHTILKISDFGISQVFPQGQEMTVEEIQGSRAYLAPELAKSNGRNEHNGPATDIFSIGVTVFVMFHGELPFLTTGEGRIIDYERGRKAETKETSRLLSDFINGMLELDPAKRLDLDQIRVHPWLNDHGRKPLISKDENVGKKICISDEDTRNAVKNVEDAGDLSLVAMNRWMTKREANPLIFKVVETRKIFRQATSQLQQPMTRFLNADNDFEYLAMFKNNLFSSSDEGLFFIRAWLLNSYQEYHSATTSRSSVTMSTVRLMVADNGGNDLPGMVSSITLSNIVKGQVLKGWKVITQDHVHKLHQHLTDERLGVFAHMAHAPAARDAFTGILIRFSREHVQKIKDTIQPIFDDEARPAPFSHRIEENIPILPHELSFLDANHDDTDDEGADDDDQDSQRLGIPQPLRTESSSPESPQPTQPLDDDHTISELFSTLVSYLPIAGERIVDKVITETMERHVINKIDDFFVMMSQVNEYVALNCQPEELERRIDVFQNTLNHVYR